MKKLYQWLLIGSFLLIIFAVPVLTWLEKPSSYSAYENRALAEPPVLTADSFWSGEYFADWETYFSDHIFKRNGWLMAYTAVEMSLLDRPVVNDVVLGEEALLQYNAPGTSATDVQPRAELMASAFARLQTQAKEWGGEVLYVGVPEQYSALRALYPEHLETNAPRLDAEETAFFAALEAAGVPALNMRDVFLSEPDYADYYAKSDHHYNLRGAIRTAEEIRRELAGKGIELPVYTSEDVTLRELPNRFYGSRGRRLFNLWPVEDRLLVYETSRPIEYERFDYGTAVEAKVLHLPGTETEDVAYTLYMGGDIGETVIRTNRPELPDVLVFGDSFTNALETVLFAGCDEFRSLDLRHYSEKTLWEYVADYQPDVILCVRDDTMYLSTDGNGSFALNIPTE